MKHCRQIGITRMAEIEVQNLAPILLLHEDTFYEFFKPYRHPKSTNDIWGGLGLETFGADYELARSLDSNFIWTVVEAGDGRNDWITPGIHYVNRICYLVTTVPHADINVEFRCPHRITSLTPLGLKRQLNKLKRACAAV